MPNEISSLDGKINDSTKVRILEKMREELVHHAVAAAPAILLVTLIIGIFPFGITKYRNFVSLMMLIAAILTCLRYILKKMEMRAKIGSKFVIDFAISSYLVNTFCWSAAFGVIFFQSETGSINCTLAFFVIAGLATGSILTMSFVPMVGLTYQGGLCLAAFLGLVNNYIRTGDSGNLVLAMTILIFFFFLWRQGHEYYRQIYQKYSYQFELEESLRQLDESQTRLVEEMARSENASRMAAIGQMANGLAHEINNPLAIIIASVEQVQRIIARNTDVPSAGPRLEKITKSSNRIGDIIKSLRYISNESDVESFQLVSVSDLLEKNVSLINNQLVGGSIKLKIDPSPNLILRTKIAHVSQVLMNLLQNSQTALEKVNESEREIRIYCVVESDKALIKVENSGPKIPPEIQEKLFQPFFTTKEVGDGSGLGLSVSRGIMQGLGGNLWFDKEQPQTTFCFSIPIAIAQKSPA